MNEIKQEIKTLTERLGQLEQLHKRSLTALDADQANQISKDIDRLSEQINKTASVVRTKLSSLSMPNHQDQGKSSRLAQTQQRKLGKSFMAVMRDLESSQTQYKQQLRQQLERQYLIVNPEATATDLESLADDQQVRLHLLDNCR